MIKKCYRCGNSYDGWECPTCAAKDAAQKVIKEQKESESRIASELSRSLSEQRSISDRAIRQQAQLAQDGWKLELESKLRRVNDLINTEMYSDAKELCLSQIPRDPGNIGIYILLNRIAHFQEDTKLEVESADKAIRLLEVEDYRENLEAHVRVAIIKSEIDLKLNKTPVNLTEKHLEKFVKIYASKTYFPKSPLDTVKLYMEEFNATHQNYLEDAAGAVKQHFQEKISQWINILDKNAFRSGLRSAKYVTKENIRLNLFSSFLLAFNINYFMVHKFSWGSVLIQSIICFLLISLLMYSYEFIHWKSQNKQIIDAALSNDTLAFKVTKTVNSKLHNAYPKIGLLLFLISLYAGYDYGKKVFAGGGERASNLYVVALLS